MYRGVSQPASPQTRTTSIANTLTQYYYVVHMYIVFLLHSHILHGPEVPPLFLYFPFRSAHGPLVALACGDWEHRKNENFGIGGC